MISIKVRKEIRKDGKEYDNFLVENSSVYLRQYDFNIQTEEFSKTGYLLL